MGDYRRFRAFADMIEQSISDKHSRIADVACGKGFLQHELRKRGFTNIVSFDKRNNWLKPRRPEVSRCFQYAYFDCQKHEGEFDVVVGMHPDGGTDHIVRYAAIHGIPFLVCPCCVVPSAVNYSGREKCFISWVRHLRNIAETKVNHRYLDIEGKNLVLVGRL